VLPEGSKNPQPVVPFVTEKHLEVIPPFRPNINHVSSYIFTFFCSKLVAYTYEFRRTMIASLISAEPLQAYASIVQWYQLTSGRTLATRAS
jgi:hypothetical protein